MSATSSATATQWLRAHRSEVPAELPARLEPTKRGHRGHAYAVLDAELVAGGDDPLDWLIAAETLRKRISDATHSDAISLCDARGALNATDRRAPGWTGADM